MCLRKQTHTQRRPLPIKYSKAEVHCKTHGLPALRFEDSQLASFSGLILLQALFARLGLKERLCRCFSHLTVSPTSDMRPWYIGERRLSLQDVPQGPVEDRALLRRQFHVRDSAEAEPEAGQAEGEEKRVSVSDRCDMGLW
jgi:hypothetical protein